MLRNDNFVNTLCIAFLLVIGVPLAAVAVDANRDGMDDAWQHISASWNGSQSVWGVTLYNRSPAEGVWPKLGTEIRDDLIIYEVTTAGLEEEWWISYRAELEQRLDQEQLAIRALTLRVF